MLDLFTVVWSKVGPFRGLEGFYCDITLPSLMQPGNIPAARGLINSYNIYADDKSRGTISQHPLFKKLCGTIPVSFLPLQKGAGDVNSNILHQMNLSAEKGNHMLTVAPDSVIGDGSVLNMARLCAEGKFDVILFGYPKIPVTAFAEIKAALATQSLSNRRLVAIVLRHTAPEPISSSTACTAIESHGVVEAEMCHRQPTPCPRPDGRIIEFFSTNFTPNQGYDHVLPMWMIDNGYTWYYIDDSDTFFTGDEAEAWRGGSGPWQLDLLSKEDQFFSNHRIKLKGE